MREGKERVFEKWSYRICSALLSAAVLSRCGIIPAFNRVEAQRVK